MRPLRIAALAALVAAAALAAGSGTAGAGAASRGVAVHPLGLKAFHLAHGAPAPISTSACKLTYGISCYTPVQYHKAYDLNPLYRPGITGAGRTIVIVDSFGSPTIANDLHDVRRSSSGLPDPNAEDREVRDRATVRPEQRHHGQLGLRRPRWTSSTRTRLRPARRSCWPRPRSPRSRAPAASREMMNAEQPLINSGVGDVITQSFGATENTFPGFATGNYPACMNLRYAFKDASGTTSRSWPRRAMTA